ncbi:MAG: hypothetical protein ACYSU8_10860 [Planctomycetota bacterium]
MTIINLSPTPEDDPGFIRLINKIINSVILKLNVTQVTIVQIDNWFDHKWLRFSGKFLGGIGIWKKELTLPPFNPNRIKHQAVYHLTGDGKYEEIKTPAIHIWQQSDQNFKRKVSEISDSGVFVWWSSNTIKNGKGSLMVYSRIGSESTSWFVSFEKDDSWFFNKAKGIPINVIEEYLA